VPVVGDPNTFAVMNTPESKQGYLELVPEDSKWENKCTAKDLIFVMFYRPLNYASKVKAPSFNNYGGRGFTYIAKDFRKMCF